MSAPKTKPEIAKAILERRNRMTHVIMPGEINAAIGADGVSEALRNRWLVPDTDSGYLCATNDMKLVEEMRKLAELPPDQYKPESIPVHESHDLALHHSKRSLREVTAPGTGQPAPALTSIAQPNPPAPQPNQPTAPPPPSSPAAPQPGAMPGAMVGGMGVGTPVTVARNGVSATGMIEKLMPDGRYKIGFSANSPHPSGSDVFGKDEMTVAAQKPGAPTTT